MKRTVLTAVLQEGGQTLGLFLEGNYLLHQFLEF